MNGKKVLYIDQYGNKWWASTVRELRSKIGGGGSRVSRMFRDYKDGTVAHVGYVVGSHWCEGYVPMRIKQ